MKSVSDYHSNAGRPDGLAVYCKPCTTAYKREWIAKRPGYAGASSRRSMAKKPEKYKAYRNAYRASDAGKRSTRKHHLKKQYGLTLEQYDEMVRRQSNLCAICESPQQVGPNLDVDHHHVNGYVRALLCHNCNVGIGFFDENIERLHVAAKYLEWHSDYFDLYEADEDV